MAHGLLEQRGGVRRRHLVEPVNLDDVVLVLLREPQHELGELFRV